MSSCCIAIFSAQYLPHVGGVEKYTYSLASELAARGHRIIIVTSAHEGCPAQEEVEPNIEIIRLPVFGLLSGRFPVTRHNAEYRNLMTYLLSQGVEKVVINTRFYRHTLEGVHLAESCGTIPIVIDHGSAHLTLGSKLLDPLVECVEHMLTANLKRHRAHYYAVSSAGANWLNHFGIKAKGVLNNSIDAQAFCKTASSQNFREEQGLSTQDFVVTFTGRLIPEKGIRELIEAARLTEHNPSIHYFIAGDGPLEEYVAKQDLHNVHFLGRINAPQIASLLLTSNVFCLPSRSEGFSTSLLEAAATSTTPLITEVGGVKELIPSPDMGIVLPNNNAATIANNILALEENREECARLAANIHNHVMQHFSWKNTADAVEIALGIK